MPVKIATTSVALALEQAEQTGHRLLELKKPTWFSATKILKALMKHTTE
jgi:hypothetical protein